MVGASMRISPSDARSGCAATPGQAAGDARQRQRLERHRDRLDADGELLAVAARGPRLVRASVPFTCSGSALGANGAPATTGHDDVGELQRQRLEAGVEILALPVVSSPRRGRA